MSDIDGIDDDHLRSNDQPERPCVEQRGYVTRTKDPTDGRQVVVTLTPDGINKVDPALVDHAANELAILKSLDNTQREQLIDLLRGLHHAIVDDPTTEPATV